MLEQLIFEIGGMCGFYSLKVQNGLETVKYQYQFPFEEDWHSGEDAIKDSDWLEMLESVNVKSWRSAYVPEVRICDGIMWSLEYKARGKRWRHIKGDNSYPETWNRFIEVISSIDGRFDLKEFSTTETEYGKRLRTV